ncbi:glycosyltransferase family 2 protein [Rahnella sp. PD12R]|uniref:glycosyltransferase family 2 protein n=1 Tax=Rahnella sp. PD12R TaxID=2855688 RepID=UPI001C44D813|nr:glycosyltransferase family 2 protein [Rahnella sp. PD12R]MBV6819538.1 glycosyltransferase family 2 protein [Rahnella sp. PD12R]
MLNIVIPMAGAGSRFAQAGFIQPKPLIPIHNVPMIKVVINNLRPKVEHRFIFIVQKKHVSQYDLITKLQSWSPGAIVIETEGLTEGAACTVLLAKKYIDNDNSLMIANSDQYIDCDIDDYLEELDRDSLDGLIMTMAADDPKWSFVGMGEHGYVTNVVEKQVISNEATVGIYNFKHGSDFVSAAEIMIDKNDRVNNEFYVAPAYNYMIERNMKIGIYNIGSEANGMYGLGIPADLNLFLGLELSTKVTSGL